MKPLFIAVIALAQLCIASLTAYAQQEQVLYYHTDAIGSVRMITDSSGQVVERHDYLPFGQEYLPPNPPSNERRLFTGKERDSETNFDYSGARYYANPAGRFITPDPNGMDPLRLVEPQRMNRYAYAVNNPLTLIDPDGRDAIVVNFSEGAVIGGVAFGHSGIISVHRNGSATFADFGPERSGTAVARGVVNTSPLPRIEFGSDGLPTRESFARIASAVAALEKGTSPTSLRLAYFKTTEAGASKLDAWIAKTSAQASSAAGVQYNVFFNNCDHYCLYGLGVASESRPATGGFALPNFDWLILNLRAAATYQMKATVSTSESYCIVTERGCQP